MSDSTYPKANSWNNWCSPFSSSANLYNATELGGNMSFARLVVIATNWALSMPAFQSLCSRDQQLLLDETLIELIIWTALQYKGNTSIDVVVSLFQQNCITIAEQCRIRDLIKYIDSSNLDQIEFTCLKALSLFRPECSGISEVQQILIIQDHAQLLLHEHTANTTHNGNSLVASPLRFGRLLLLLSAVKRLNKHHFAPIHGSLFNFALLQTN
ncbi:hypothetical protein B4U79_12217 [Dinothrombium tinctorium]|uniref:NR LBD domain-containing protein n=1 Tax=Dinothrombium tinctorium TaxID=1965070 RepID=A0A443R0Z6_9ACAR|nr:hypothetical protein B4U79_12217 [Dinothrombium tinctorium]